MRMAKLTLTTALILLVAITLVGWTRYIRNHSTKEMIIETRGLAELEIDLEAPYGTHSLQHVLLINKGPHYILACDILFEATTADDRVFTARKVVYSYPLFEKDLVKRKALLQSEPGIAPNSKWLIGFDEIGLQSVSRTLPRLGSDRWNAILPDPRECKHLRITLNGVVIESGQAFGPLAQEFLRHLEEQILKERVQTHGLQ
jgi:hypothetical protein